MTNFVRKQFNQLQTFTPKIDLYTLAEPCTCTLFCVKQYAHLSAFIFCHSWVYNYFYYVLLLFFILLDGAKKLLLVLSYRNVSTCFGFYSHRTIIHPTGVNAYCFRLLILLDMASEKLSKTMEINLWRFN